eukprot:gene25174-10808_t
MTSRQKEAKPPASPPMNPLGKDLLAEGGVGGGDEMDAKEREKEAKPSASPLMDPLGEDLLAEGGVDGCLNDLNLEKCYFRRSRCCGEHLRAFSSLVNGVTSRFCQQCGRFHELHEFDETRKSCRSKLMSHNVRRRVSLVNGGKSSGTPSKTKPEEVEQYERQYEITPTQYEITPTQYEITPAQYEMKLVQYLDSLPSDDLSSDCHLTMQIGLEGQTSLTDVSQDEMAFMYTSMGQEKIPSANSFLTKGMSSLSAQCPVPSATRSPKLDRDPSGDYSQIQFFRGGQAGEAVHGTGQAQSMMDRLLMHGDSPPCSDMSSAAQHALQGSLPAVPMTALRLAKPRLHSQRGAAWHPIHLPQSPAFSSGAACAMIAPTWQEVQAAGLSSSSAGFSVSDQFAMPASKNRLPDVPIPGFAQIPDSMLVNRSRASSRSNECNAQLTFSSSMHQSSQLSRQLSDAQLTFSSSMHQSSQLSRQLSELALSGLNNTDAMCQIGGRADLGAHASDMPLATPCLLPFCLP